MNLGLFSLSLAVKDIKISRAFYEKLGFSVYAGDEAQNWLVLKNGETIIGLFQDMFEKNILTFNPGWDTNGQPIPEFTDVRVLQHQLKEKGLHLTEEADENTSGRAYFSLLDPDGNQILIDQHV